MKPKGLHGNFGWDLMNNVSRLNFHIVVFFINIIIVICIKYCWLIVKRIKYQITISDYDGLTTITIDKEALLERIITGHKIPKYEVGTSLLYHHLDSSVSYGKMWVRSGWPFQNNQTLIFPRVSISMKVQCKLIVCWRHMV